MEADACCGRSPRSVAGSSACCMAPFKRIKSRRCATYPYSLGLRREILVKLGAVCLHLCQEYVKTHFEIKENIFDLVRSRISDDLNPSKGIGVPKIQ